MNTRLVMYVLLYFTSRLRRGFAINSTERIINGWNENIESVPYMLTFMLDGEYACCAAIINERWAVTAAHCVRAAEDLDKNISLSSGASLLYDGVVHDVTEAIVHEKFDETTNDYDIAVVRVSPPFEYDNFTGAVDLAPDNAEEIDRESGVVCGWGYYLRINGIIDPALSQSLRCVVLPLIEKSQCIEDYEWQYKVTPRMTCYGTQEGEKDTCKGDSGGPLVNKDKILLGVTSWGDGCAERDKPGVYTDAVLLRNWIEDRTDT